MNMEQAPSSAQPLTYVSGHVDITPMRPVPLAGFADRMQPYSGVAGPLEANVVLLRDGDTLFVVIAMDLLFIGSHLREKLEVSLKLIVLPSNFFLAASHTHFAPASDPTLPKLGAVDPDYMELVVQRVLSLVKELLRLEWKPLHAGLTQGLANHSVNRRWTGWRLSRRFPFLCKRVCMRPNLRGIKDETVRVIRIGTDTIVWNYACHPVFIPTMNHVSADYIGMVRTALRNKFGEATTVLFWQGFSGNTYPSFASSLVTPAARIQRLLFRRSPSVHPEVWQRWTRELAGSVIRTVEGAKPFMVYGRIQSMRAVMSVKELLGDQAPAKSVIAHRLRIGTKIDVLGLSAEPVVDYVAHMHKVFKNEQMFCVGCIDGVFGYLPTQPMVDEGGYEAVEFLPYFSLQGQFSRNLERILDEGLLANLAMTEYITPDADSH